MRFTFGSFPRIVMGPPEICALNFANGKDVGWALVQLGSAAPEDPPLRRVSIAEVDGCLGPD